MRTPLIASSALLALAASFATASAALIIHTTPGLVSPALGSVTGVPGHLALF